MFGRADVEKISQNFKGKTPKQVVEYHKVFWRRCKELQDYDRITSQIEICEAKRQRKYTIKRALDAKVKQDICSQLVYSFLLIFCLKIATYRSPFHQLHLIHVKNRGKLYTIDEDRFLICSLHQLGIDKDNVYNELRNAVR